MPKTRSIYNTHILAFQTQKLMFILPKMVFKFYEMDPMFKQQTPEFKHQTPTISISNFMKSFLAFLMPNSGICIAQIGV